jgi:hypothetical protein
LWSRVEGRVAVEPVDDLVIADSLVRFFLAVTGSIVAKLDILMVEV